MRYFCDNYLEESMCSNFLLIFQVILNARLDQASRDYQILKVKIGILLPGGKLLSDLLILQCSFV